MFKTEENDGVWLPLHVFNITIIFTNKCIFCIKQNLACSKQLQQANQPTNKVTNKMVKQN